MKKDKLPQSQDPKIISKRRINNSNKEYLVQNKEDAFVWTKLNQTIQKEAKLYDEEQKGILPYFPTVFEMPNSKVHIYIEDKTIQVSYNDRPITSESHLSKKARLEIHKELNSLLPVQLYESMYHQAKEKKKIEELFIEKQNKKKDD